MVSWAVPPRGAGLDFSFLTSAKAYRRMFRRDLVELTPSTSLRRAILRSLERRRQIEQFLADPNARSREFLEIPSFLQSGEGPTLDPLFIELPSDQSGQIARLRVQIDNPAMLLIERLTDAIIFWARQKKRSLSMVRVRVDAAYDRVGSQSYYQTNGMSISNYSLSDMFSEFVDLERRVGWPFWHGPDFFAEIRPTSFPYRAVVETNDTGLVEFLRRPDLRDWVGMGVDYSPPYGHAGNTGQADQRNCVNGRRGRISGQVRVFDSQDRHIKTLWATCAHVVPDCQSVIVRGNFPSKSPDNEWRTTDIGGQVYHAPDAALIDMQKCRCARELPDDSSGSATLSWPYRADEAATLHLPAMYLGAAKSNARGYVLSPHSFWEIEGCWYRCPALELLSYRSLLDQIFRRNQSFSSPGDSGSWIANERQEHEWLGMINADRMITKSSFATEGKFLAEYFLEELRQMFGSDIRIELEAQ